MNKASLYIKVSICRPITPCNFGETLIMTTKRVNDSQTSPISILQMCSPNPNDLLEPQKPQQSGSNYKDRLIELTSAT